MQKVISTLLEIYSTWNDIHSQSHRNDIQWHVITKNILLHRIIIIHWSRWVLISILLHSFRYPGNYLHPRYHIITIYPLLAPMAANYWTHVFLRVINAYKWSFLGVSQNWFMAITIFTRSYSVCLRLNIITLQLIETFHNGDIFNCFLSLMFWLLLNHMRL